MTALGRQWLNQRIRILTLLAVGFGAQAASLWAGETPSLEAGGVPQAPPPAPPIEVRTLPPRPPSPRPHQVTLYSIGDPTDEEQLYLEYINRSRANPPAEGARLASSTDPNVLSAYQYFNVDLGLVQSDFNAIPPSQPLAMNPQLLAAARLHSSNMFTLQYQGHYETNGATVLDPGDRITAQGYTWSTYGENLFAYALSVWYGHAGLNVDWNNAPNAIGGVENPPGHRQNIANPGFREVGIGVLDGSNGPVGPQLVTEDFATAQGATPFITGVVYYDLGGNNFYDVGEGIGGVTVTVNGSTYYAITANSGGYAIPVPGNGSYAVTFSNGSSSTQLVATVANFANVKLDYTPAYSPPVISGPTTVALNGNNTFTFTPVAAAAAYQWEQAQLTPFTTVEGAETGLSQATAVTSTNYSVIASDYVAAGSFSFHLAHPDPPTPPQYVTFHYNLLPSASSQLTFYGRLGWASTNETARALVSTDNGATWQEVWSQVGPGGRGATGFTLQSVSLAKFANQPILLRFAYDYTDGTYYPAQSGVGFYFDNIAVSGASQLGSAIDTDISGGTSFVFFPTSLSSYALRVRTHVPGRYLSWGPLFRVTASAVALPSVRFTRAPAVSNGQVQIPFDITNYRVGMTLQLLKAADITGPWTVDNGAAFQTAPTFAVTTSLGAAPRTFYRLQAN